MQTLARTVSACYNADGSEVRMNQKKEQIPGAALGLYVCTAVMTVLFMMSIVGIAIGGADGTRPYFILAALVTALAIIACLLVARFLRKKQKRKKPTFASYAFEGELAPQKKTVPPDRKKPNKH